MQCGRVLCSRLILLIVWLYIGVVLQEGTPAVSGAVLSFHADNEASQTAAGVTTSSGTQFCRQCNSTRETMYHPPEYVDAPI